MVGAVFIRGLGVLSGEQWVKNETMMGVSALQYLSVGTTAVAYDLFFFLLDRYPAIEVILVTCPVPVIAAVARGGRCSTNGSHGG